MSSRRYLPKCRVETRNHIRVIPVSHQTSALPTAALRSSYLSKLEHGTKCLPLAVFQQYADHFDIRISAIGSIAENYIPKRKPEDKADENTKRIQQWITDTQLYQQT